MHTRGFDDIGHYYTSDLYQHNIDFDNNYIKKTYDNNIKMMAENYYNKMLYSYLQPEYMKIYGKKPKFNIKFLKIPFIYLLRKFNKKYNNKYDYIDFEQYKNTWNVFLRYINYLRIKKYYNKADLSKKFAYFPLHFQPEATTIVCAQKYEKQLFYIDQIAKSLPADTILYVKEHYSYVGHRNLNFYKEIKNYSNVLLIDPWEKSKDLIMHCQVVITLTGTAGWEGFILGKPVIICGNMFYDNAPNIIHLEDIYNNYIQSLNNWQKPTKDQIINYLCENIDSMCDGCQSQKLAIYNNSDNLTKLGNSLAKKIYSIVNNSYNIKEHIHIHKENISEKS